MGMRPSEMSPAQFRAYCDKLWAVGPAVPAPEPGPADWEPYAGDDGQGFNVGTSNLMWTAEA